MEARPGRDMPPNNPAEAMRRSLEREPGLACSMVVVQPKRAGVLEREIRLQQVQQLASLPLTAVKQIQLQLSSLHSGAEGDEKEGSNQRQVTEQIRSQLLLPSKSGIQALNWDATSNQSTQYLIELPTTEAWDWTDRNIQAKPGARLVVTHNVSQLAPIKQQYSSETITEVELIEQKRQFAVARWLLRAYEKEYELTTKEADDTLEELRDAIYIDQQPLTATTALYRQLFSDFRVTKDQFLHAIRLATIEEELIALEGKTVSPLEKQLSMLAALPDLTSDDIHWIARLFPTLQDYLIRMGIAAKKKIEHNESFLSEELQPAPPITALLQWQFPQDAQKADDFLKERLGIDDFRLARDHYQQLKTELIKQIGMIFTLAGMNDQFHPNALSIDAELDNSFLLNQIRFAQKVIGVYEADQDRVSSLSERRNADAKRFEARRMASCLADISSALKRRTGYESFAPTVHQLVKGLGYDWVADRQKPAAEQGRAVLHLQRSTGQHDGSDMELPVRWHFRPEKSSTTFIEKLFRNGDPNDLTKETDFFASSIVVMLPRNDQRLSLVPPPESLTFWNLEADGGLVSTLPDASMIDHAAVFDFMHTTIQQIKTLFSKERLELHIIKYQPTGSFRGRSKGSREQSFPGMSRFVVHGKINPTWANPNERRFMKEFQLFCPTDHQTAAECYELKQKDEQIEDELTLTYQLRRIERLALLFFSTRFYPQMRLLPRAYQQAKNRLPSS